MSSLAFLCFLMSVSVYPSINDRLPPYVHPLISFLCLLPSLPRERGQSSGCLIYLLLACIFSSSVSLHCFLGNLFPYFHYLALIQGCYLHPKHGMHKVSKEVCRKDSLRKKKSPPKIMNLSFILSFPGVHEHEEGRLMWLW